MIKKLALVACMSFAIAACSSDSNTESTAGTTTPTPTTPTPTTPTPTTPTPTTPTGSITPSGTTQGVWFGNTSFGEGVVIVNGAGGVTGLSSNGAGQYEAVFGNAGAAMERFFHRDSDNPSNATSFTLAGDLPSTTDPAQADTLTYNLAAANDGQQLNNTGTAGNFSMTFATENDIATIDAASIAGTWVGLTSFCPADCNVTLSVSFAADGSFTGYTQFNDFDQLPLTGTASDSGSAQYLNVSLQWNGQQRDGVVYRDRNTSRLVLNTIGVDGENGNRSFTAYLTQQ